MSAASSSRAAGDGHDRLAIHRVAFTSSSPRDRADGLLGWVRCELVGGLRLDSIALRRTRDGRRCLSFPGRRDGKGHMRSYFSPINDAARIAIEEQIFAALDSGQPEAE